MTKIYRQVDSDESDCDLFRNLWCGYVTDEIQEPYHPTRALQESGKSRGPNLNTTNMILNDFCVDDLLGGADFLEQSCVLKVYLIKTPNKNCQPLCKLSSSESQLVNRLVKELQEAGEAYEVIYKPHQMKTLELTWHPLESHFVYACCSKYVSTVNKRTLRSDVSQHFDPNGLIAPVFVVAKVIFQSCWKLDLEWNDAVPSDVPRAYTNWKDDMGKMTL